MMSCPKYAGFENVGKPNQVAQSSPCLFFESNKYIFSALHNSKLMRLIYSIFVLLMVLMPFVQCQQTAEDWFDKGLALYKQSKYDEAIVAYDEAIRLNPNLVAVWGAKGIALYSQGRYNESIKAFDEAIRLNPNLAASWGGKGLAFDGQGNYDGAIKAYDEAIRNDPTSVAAWIGKGLALVSQGDYDGAIEHMTRPSG